MAISLIAVKQPITYPFKQIVTLYHIKIIFEEVLQWARIWHDLFKLN